MVPAWSLAHFHPAFSGLGPGLIPQSFHLSHCSEFRRHLCLPTGSSAFTGNTKRLRDALSRESQYSPLIDGTWGYVIHNLSKERLLVGAFRLEAKHGSLLIPKGLTFKVTKRGKRSPWLDWKSELVAYDGTQLGCFYEGTLLARKLEYARNVRAAWLLREGADLLTFAGEAFPLSTRRAGADVVMRAERLNVKREDSRSLDEIVSFFVSERSYEELAKLTGRRIAA